MTLTLNENEIFPILEDLLSNLGLVARGGFQAKAEDPYFEGASTVLVIGNAGSAMWQAFTRDVPPLQRQAERNPLDNWTRKVISEIALKLGCRALYPFEGPPYYPFQRWAMESENLSQSPIGPLIHSEYGMWHAYRAVLVFDSEIEVKALLESKLKAPIASTDICARCIDKPCLNSCPVNAFASGHYDVPVCAAHLNSPEGSDCMGGGCQARRSCPIGQDYIYKSEHANFHMEKFRISHTDF